MSRQVRRSLALALAGLLGGLGLVLALFGGESLRKMIDRHEPEPPAATAPAPHGGLRSLTDPGATAESGAPPIDFRDDTTGGPKTGAPKTDATKPDETRSAARAPEAPAPGETRSAERAPADKPAEPDAAEVPRFDIVRVEPNGDAVVAGRGAPEAVIEMLVDGKTVARATADANGQFALVPPTLPTGSSALRLRMTTKDGRAADSRQSVAVDVAPNRDRQPLVALTAPDAATVVLSQPNAPEPAKGTVAQAGKPAADGKAPAAQIVSVDVQENGRLFVTATGIPGAKLRLYLNDTLIAPGSVGPDGRASFTIGRGVKAGQYQVRIDQIDPRTGKVTARAEVPFAVPEPTRVATGEGAGREPSGHASPGSGQGASRPQATSSNPAEMPSALSPDSTGASGPARAGAVFVPEITTAKITRGDNLWRISQRTYGRGERYTVIYDANQNQIRDPDRIYPGQIFILPTDKRG
ncbi:LysM peptidoglycan-binding domain-containing protein [Methylobacterium pseudosasicola]|uniref:Nucleoid-associated protein YgaU, contains BON and LysM domains n=1 Tax=Methylobacterium pseudosasicola TaxID=582667 RepID=A0A1I4G3X0_9HYPH|nr:LysM peptidoglycan-binding domain-containing protein [Methylobacterium pseudosasicola]SFL24724.1 Nucleoid-associated protein YgaU, contains BON and LysM domains [Methylobacterium pseudosasicola]